MNSEECLQTKEKEKGKGNSNAVVIDWGTVETAKAGHSQLFTCNMNSGKWINSLSTVHVACEQLRVTGLHCFHHPSIYHHHAALPLPLLLLLRLETLSTVHMHMQREQWIHSPIFMLHVHVNSGECLYCSWPNRIWPKPKCIEPVRPSKIKKIQKQILRYCVLLKKKLMFNIN